MIPRKPPRIPFPKLSIKKVEEKAASGEISSENSEKTINYLKSRYFNQNRLKEGEADPKLAGAILELAQGSDPLRTMLILGRGAVRVPKETVGLHLDFAKAQYGGHMGARKFALLNLPRMKFYNPHLDIKVFRRPWAGRLVQKTYPCTATILKYNGEIETIDMRGKRSMKIYDEIMSAIRAVDLSEEFVTAKEKAKVIAKPYLKWV